MFDNAACFILIKFHHFWKLSGFHKNEINSVINAKSIRNRHFTEPEIWPRRRK
jgi:hypothetical protein